jgi:ATPase subunit of ABC transporter with duplicated ATPase domains
MEEHFSSRDVSLVVVTHDRAFMEAVCTSVLELEDGEAHFHSFGGPGSYARFRQVRPFLSICGSEHEAWDNHMAEHDALS